MKKVIIGVFAHPDDEGFGPSGTLIQAAKAGTDVHLICATAGELGQNPDNYANLAAERLKEWRMAGELIDATSMHHLGFHDGELCNAVYLKVASCVQQTIDDIIAGYDEAVELTLLTFDPEGISGHLDHIAISRIATYVYHQLRAEKLANAASLALHYFCLPKSKLPAVNTDWLYMPAGRADELIDITNDVHVVLETKLAVMHAHHSQRQDAEAIKTRQGDDLRYENFWINREG